MNVRTVLNQGLGLLLGVAITAAALTVSASVTATSPQVDKGAARTVVVQDVTASPPAIHFTARVLDPATGLPKPNGSYNIAFNIYPVSFGGAPLWGEVKSVTVANGVFSTLLGDTNPLALGIFNGQELFLGISVGADPEASPRHRIAHTAYAVYAETANSANIATTAENANNLGGNAPSFYAQAVHDHDDRYYTEAEADPRFINSAGPDAMTGTNDAPILNVNQAGRGHGVRGNVDAAIIGSAGVAGTAGSSGLTINSHSGVLGDSLNGRGVIGVSKNNDGVLGFSDAARGVSGQSLNNYGVYAYSQNSLALQVDGTARANKLLYNSPRTHYVSVSGDSFHPRSVNSGISYSSAGGTAGAYFTSSDTASDNRLLAALNLPNGAQMTNLTGYFFDSCALDIQLSVLKHTTTGGFTYVTTIGSSGLSGAGSRSAAMNEVVDNSNTFYELYVDGPSTWESCSSNLRIIGATVTYTISEAE